MHLLQSVVLFCSEYTQGPLEISSSEVAAEGSETVRVGRLCGPHRPEPKPFGQANLVALGPEIAQTRLPWLSVTILICYTFWILLLGRLAPVTVHSLSILHHDRLHFFCIILHNFFCMFLAYCTKFL